MKISYFINFLLGRIVIHLTAVFLYCCFYFPNVTNDNC